VLLQQLPEDSRTQTLLRDKRGPQELLSPASGEQKFGRWALLNYQVAHLLNIAQHLLYVTSQANSEQRISAPEPIPMPGSTRRRAVQSEAGIFYLDQLRARG
jgi:hypothetical protein